jgi:5,10-methylene-tetrahydrofolate dehydrogenase/methenyl tetrahydrofolate cyclohydrolase
MEVILERYYLVILSSEALISYLFNSGVPGLVRADMVSEGTVVIDVGHNRVR